MQESKTLKLNVTYLLRGRVSSLLHGVSSKELEKTGMSVKFGGLAKAINPGTRYGFRLDQISFRFGNEERGRNLKAIGNSVGAAHRQIPHAPFNVTHVGSMQPCKLGHLLLACTFALAMPFDDHTKRSEKPRILVVLHHELT